MVRHPIGILSDSVNGVLVAARLLIRSSSAVATDPTRSSIHGGTVQAKFRPPYIRCVDRGHCAIHWWNGPETSPPASFDVVRCVTHMLHAKKDTPASSILKLLPL